MATMLATILILRSRSGSGLHWSPVSNPGDPLVVDAYIGKKSAVVGRVAILLKSVDRAGNSFTADVIVDGEPEMVIKGGEGARFRDKGSTIEIQAADLGQESARFNVWTVQP